MSVLAVHPGLGLFPSTGLEQLLHPPAAARLEHPEHPPHPEHPEHPLHPEHPIHPEHPLHPSRPEHPAHPEAPEAAGRGVDDAARIVEPPARVPNGPEAQAASFRSILQVTQITLQIRIERQTTRIVQGGPMPTGPAAIPNKGTFPWSGGSTSAVAERVADLDARLGQDFQRLLDFIGENNPQLAAFLEQILDFVLDHLEEHQPKLMPLVTPDRGAGPSAGTLGPLDDFMPLGPAMSGVPLVTAGRADSFRFAIDASFTDVRWQFQNGSASYQSVRVSFAARFQQVLGSADPLVLDLNGNGVFDTTTVAQGHRFDLLASGRKVLAATTTGGDGLLVLDRNRNGRVDDGSELFGDQNGAPDGFFELARHDENRDGRIDLADSVFEHLRIFEDRNRNGQTDLDELRTLAQLGIASLGLTAVPTEDEESNGNRVSRAGSFLRRDGTSGRLGDVLFDYLA